MAVLTFELNDGLKIGESVYTEVGLRELDPEDVFEAQLAAEKIGMINNRPYAYTSDVVMGMELLRRQVEFIGKIGGPVSIKELFMLSQKDFALVQQKASELDQALFADDTMEAVETRGRD